MKNHAARMLAGVLVLGMAASAAAADASPQSTDSGSMAFDAEPAAKKGRNITYKVTPDGLVIQVEGLELRPSATVVKRKGGWGVDVALHASATDRQVLSNPSGGPMAFAATVHPKKGSPKKFGDQREGDGTVVLEAGQKKTFHRVWPGGKEAPAWWGEKLELEVGLWGLGDDEERRPVRKLFVLKMVAGNDAKAIISPPDV